VRAAVCPDGCYPEQLGAFDSPPGLVPRVAIAPGALKRGSSSVVVAIRFSVPFTANRTRLEPQTHRRRNKGTPNGRATPCCLVPVLDGLVSLTRCPRVTQRGRCGRRRRRQPTSPIDASCGRAPMSWAAHASVASVCRGGGRRSRASARSGAVHGRPHCWVPPPPRGDRFAGLGLGARRVLPTAGCAGVDASEDRSRSRG
jgi:hypothetical protein